MVKRAGVSITPLFVFLFVVSTLLSLHVAAALAQRKITFATSTAGGARMMTDVMKANKFDKKHGLDLDLKFFPGAKAVQAVIFNKTETGVFNPLVAAHQLAEGHHFVNFEIAMDVHVSVLVPPGSPIKTVAELKGKKFGFFSRGSGIYPAFQMIMALRGRDIEKEFQLIIGNPFAIKAFLQRKQVDGAIQFEPFTSVLLTNNQARQIAWVGDMWNKATGNRPLLFVTIAARKSWIDANPKAARNLARAIAETRAWIVAHPDEAVKLGNKALKITDPKVIETVKKRMIPIYKTPWDDAAVKAGNWFFTKAVEFGILEKLPAKNLFAKF